MVRIVNGEIVQDGPTSRRNSTHTTPLIGGSSTPSMIGTPSLTSMPSLTLGSSAIPPTTQNGMMTPPSNHMTPRGTSPAIHQPTTTSPPPLTLSAQFTNPYLSHTSYVTGGHQPITSGEGFADDQAITHAAQVAQAAHAQAQAQALAAAYYPYHLHGFLGPGFILGHNTPATVPAPAASGQETLAGTDSASPPPSTLPVLPVHPPSSSCPSPLLTSTSERRKSKPHVQFIPPTHSVTPNGLVVPVMQPHTNVKNAPTKSTSARVSHAFNLFGLPPVFIYEIRIPPHVYLLTGLILYAIGPPALIPLVVCFFFYRWHTASRDRERERQSQPSADSSTLRKPIPPTGHPSGMPFAAAAHGSHLSGMPKSHPSPLLTQRRHPNIHSLYDT